MDPGTAARALVRPLKSCGGGCKWQSLSEQPGGPEEEHRYPGAPFTGNFCGAPCRRIPCPACDDPWGGRGQGRQTCGPPPHPDAGPQAGDGATRGGAAGRAGGRAGGQAGWRRAGGVRPGVTALRAPRRCMRARKTLEEAWSMGTRGPGLAAGPGRCGRDRAHTWPLAETGASAVPCQARAFGTGPGTAARPGNLQPGHMPPHGRTFSTSGAAATAITRREHVGPKLSGAGCRERLACICAADDNARCGPLWRRGRGRQRRGRVLRRG